MEFHLDQEEQEILEAFEQANLYPVADSGVKIKEAQAAAANTASKISEIIHSRITHHALNHRVQ